MVTAQRTEENARTVPMSISAFTETMIKDRQIIGITDLQLNTPNLTYSQDNFGDAKVVIRGIGDTAGGLSPVLSPVQAYPFTSTGSAS